MATDTGNSKLDLIWGVSLIAKEIGLSERQTFHLVASGKLPAKKVGGRWVVERGQLARFFMAADGRAA